jgi:plasmid stabilization system protein ParE
MEFQVKVTRYAQGEIESAYLWFKRYDADFADRWFRGLMNKIATLQEKPKRCALARENSDFVDEIRQLVYGKSSNRYRVIFLIEDNFVHILSVRRGSQSGLDFNPLDLEE